MLRTAFATGECEHGRHHVDHAQRLVDDARLELIRPIENRRHADATLVQRAFAAAKFAVRGRRFLFERNTAALLALLRRSRAGREQRIGGAAVVA
jgi:hypothetical protein